METYTMDDKLNDILDKILKYGIKQITATELEFLDSYSKGRQYQTYDKISKEDWKIFEDKYFRFEYFKLRKAKGETHIVGTFYVPDMMNKHVLIKGCIKGEIIIYENKAISLYFEKGGYDIIDFCEGIEYELDKFVDYIIDRLRENAILKRY